MPTLTVESVGYLPIVGCNPSSLLGWLKAVGLMAMTKQPGYWQADCFYLQVESLEAVVENFLNHYTPKPIANPWNQASGFLKAGGVDPYLNSPAERWSQVAKTFKRIQDQLATEDLSKPSDVLKLSLYPKLRGKIRDEAFQDWLAAVMMIREVKGKPKSVFNPLLGGGGNISTVDLGAVYLYCCQILWSLETGEVTPKAKVFAEAAIANLPLKNSLLEKAVLCHLFPLADFFGELQNTSGSEDYPPNGSASSQISNPVDFILAIEGLLNFGGSLSEEKDGEFQGWTTAYYPLVLEVNAGSAETSDRTPGSTEEVWLPIWDEPLPLTEFREGVLSDLKFRLANQVSDTLDFLQLLANRSESLKFHRYSRFGFWRRKGQGNYAVHIGLAVPGQPDLGSQLRQWRKSVKPRANQSNELYNLLMALEKSLTALAAGTASLQKLLILLGRVELTLSRHGMPYHPPQPQLTEEWVNQAYTENPSPEFRLAAALASTRLRKHLSRARYSPGKNTWFWSQQTHPMRSHSLTVLAEDLLRQWDRAEQHPCKQFLVYASLMDVQAFIEGVLDESLILQLAIGLSLCKIPQKLWEPESAVTPAAYRVAAKLLWNKDLNLNQASISALRRGSTLPLQVHARKQGVSQAIPPTTQSGQRIANALIFPVKI